MNFLKLCEELTNQIQDSYESGITMEEAEKLAGKFLYAQIQVSEELKKSDLDARMRKSGLKAIRAAVYLDAATKGDKKPSDVLLEHLINQTPEVNQSQDGMDKAESERDHLQNYLNIFKDAHIHFRSIAKGSFGG